jgi:hypothetical protein
MAVLLVVVAVEQHLLEAFLTLLVELLVEQVAQMAEEMVALEVHLVDVVLEMMAVALLAALQHLDQTLLHL